MQTLRAFAHDPSVALLSQVISRFDYPDEPNNLRLTAYAQLTPDSFLWRITAGEKVMYLYAEDYVPGLAYVMKAIGALVPQPRRLIEVRERRSFSTSSPVRGALAYQAKDDAEEMMRYALPLGCDFVFLIETEEDEGENLLIALA